ncbi:MAG TPA: hypothetical protein VK866_18890 [Acidimicrobiales bacterium]|nr:hypothetical protein [Acidimicrobiales bacterium]
MDTDDTTPLAATAASLGAKLDQLDLTVAETELLHRLLGLPEAEVSGYGFLESIKGTNLLDNTKGLSVFDGNPIGTRVTKPTIGGVATTALGNPQI